MEFCTIFQRTNAIKAVVELTLTLVAELPFVDGGSGKEVVSEPVVESVVGSIAEVVLAPLVGSIAEVVLAPLDGSITIVVLAALIVSITTD
jgi:hypothetical protein